MILQSNNYGEPLYFLFTQGPGLPDRPNAWHIHVTADLYRYGGAVYSPQEPSDTTVFWVKTASGKGVQTQGAYWGANVSEGEFGGYRYDVKGVYKWNGSMWENTEAVIWDGSAWVNANPAGGPKIIFGVYYTGNWPAPLEDVPLAFVFNSGTSTDQNIRRFLSSRYTSESKQYGTSLYIQSSGSLNAETTGMHVIIRGEPKCYRNNGSTYTNVTFKSRYWALWNGSAYEGGSAGSTPPELTYQFSVSDEKPASLSSPGYWFKHPNASRLTLRGDFGSPGANGITCVYKSDKSVVIPGVTDAKICNITTVYFGDENSQSKLATKGTEWDYWSGSAWESG